MRHLCSQLLDSHPKLHAAHEETTPQCMMLYICQCLVECVTRCQRQCCFLQVNPVVLNCIEFCSAHYICEWVIIRVNSKMGGIEEVVPKVLTHCPLQSQEV